MLSIDNSEGDHAPVRRRPPWLGRNQDGVALGIRNKDRTVWSYGAQSRTSVSSELNAAI